MELLEGFLATLGSGKGAEKCKYNLCVCDAVQVFAHPHNFCHCMGGLLSPS